MNLSPMLPSGVLEWIFRASWQAAVLAGLVLLAQTLLGKRLTPTWRYRLWLLVVVRLVLPFHAPSPTSVHNLARFTTPAASPNLTAPSVVVPATPVQPPPPSTDVIKEPGPSSPGAPGFRAHQPPDRTRSTGVTPDALEPEPPATTQPSAPAASGRRPLERWLAWIWLAGVAGLGLRMAAQHLLFARRLRRDGTSAPSFVLRQLEACQAALGVRTRIRAVETDQVTSPAVYGLLRPTLLLPRGLVGEFSSDQLRFVLLHEVAHVKRGDTTMAWVMGVLQVLHWFNPAVWLAFTRMRVDRELACDALVLSSSRDEEAMGYGETILRLLEVMNRGNVAPGLVGILEDKHQIRERIRGIARFRRPGRASASALLLLLALGWVGLTDAAPGSKPLPPVVPLHLTNLLVHAENRAWLEEPVWKAPPRGSNTFGGIEFHIEGMIQLFGTGPEREEKIYRERVVVPLISTNTSGSRLVLVQHGTNVGSLHLIGATAYDAPPETRIAEVVWRYTDGSFKRSPIRYGVEVRDWWRARFEQPPRVTGPHAKVIWRGTHPDSARYGRSLRLYRFTLANPEPKRTIRQLELVSSRARPALIVLAMTLDPLKPGERPDDSPDLEELDPEPTSHLRVTVLNGEDQPIPGAEIRVRVKAAGESDNGVALPTTFTSDAQGLADVLWPGQGTERLTITVSKPDHTARRMLWDLKTGDTVPAAHTIKLRGAIRIGGTVVDPDNQPVAGATVILGRYWMGGERRGAKGDDVEFERQEHTTGADGRWAAGNIPPEILARIGITARHPDFLNARVIGNPTRETLASLTNQTHVLTLPRGLDASGRVVDEQDQPIPNATVWLGDRNTAERQETRTDTDGRFTFRNAKEGRTLFSVLARSYEPATRHQAVQAGMPDVLFRLTAGTVVRGRVENAEGEPLAGARVYLEGDGNIGRTYEFSTRTDDDGRFEWDGAPREPMQFYLYSPGYEQKRNHPIPPNQDNVIVLRRNRRVVGQVVNEDTGAPLTRFRLAVGRAWEGSAEKFYADHPGLTDYTTADGRFEIELNDEDTNGIQAEAEDHAGVIQVLPPPQRDVVEITLRLKPSPGLHARVVDVSGRPVPGASVTVVEGPLVPGQAHRAVQFRAGRFAVEWREGVATTGDDGRFSLPSPPLEGWVHAATETGFASLPIAAVRSTQTLVLQPYGRIEGTLTVLGQPLAGEEFLLGLSALGLQADFNLHRHTTDAQGRFTIEQVPPGEVGLIRIIKSGPRSWAHGQQTPVRVEPGLTSRITVGDAGAVLTGRARLENPPAGDDWFITGTLRTRGPKVPEAFNSQAEAEAFFASPEWTEHQRTQKFYPVKVSADGSVLLDSIVPGVYTLSLSAEVPGEQPWQNRTIATAATEVIIPAETNPLTPVRMDDLLLKPTPAP